MHKMPIKRKNALISVVSRIHSMKMPQAQRNDAEVIVIILVNDENDNEC